MSTTIKKLDLRPVTWRLSATEPLRSFLGPQLEGERKTLPNGVQEFMLFLVIDESRLKLFEHPAPTLREALHRARESFTSLNADITRVLNRMPL